MERHSIFAHGKSILQICQAFTNLIVECIFQSKTKGDWRENLKKQLKSAGKKNMQEPSRKFGKRITKK